MNLLKLLTFGVLIGMLPAASVQASTLIVGHGIDGRDLGLAQSLPVDIEANGTCLLTGVTFGTFSQPLEVEPGRYDVTVRLSNGSCTGAVALTQQFTLALTEHATAFAHITEQGTPTLTKFVNDVRATTDSAGRLSFRHAAAASGVVVAVGPRSRRGGLSLLARNSQQDTREVNALHYRPLLVDQQTDKSLARVSVRVANNELVNVYAVGSLGSETFTLLEQRIAVQ